ncbi:histone-lysine N-methyltransferase SUVR3-like [Bidens hawaiensis]|uniref:histone-lysine N-methyltransferase SUVR3-like n=1 Tax=Bidens hawaiensis TaxID=980011 RepID=UPI00404A9BF3
MDTNEKKKPTLSNQLSTAAAYILPHLHPADLAAVALTCKTLHLAVKSITAARSSDASRNTEQQPIPFINDIDNHPYAYFIYTPTQFIPDARPDPVPDPGLIQSREDGFICDCESVKLSGVIWECGSGCRNRVGQDGVNVGLKIVRGLRKGWGLHADEVIKEGEFVCEYAGELLTTKEARNRQSMYDKLTSSGKHTSALLVVREHLPSGNACLRINIDATKYGNVARFINHSCDGGNLVTVLVRKSGALIPRVCFFASRDILKDEELTFSYGDAGLNPMGSKCFCGSSCCSGIMPSEQT